MGKRLSEAEWAKVRRDREEKHFSFGELAEKYGIGKATIHRKAKQDNWKDTDTPNPISPKTPNSPKPNETVKRKTVGNIKPNCLQDEPKPKTPKTKNKPEPKPQESEQPDDIDPDDIDDDLSGDDEDIETRDERWERKRKERQDKKQNGTTNGTNEKENSFNIQEYIDGIKNSFDPSRARDQRFISFQLEQIGEHLGDLSKAFDSTGQGKYRPEFCRIAYSIALLGGTPERLAEALGVTKQTVLNWLSTYPEFNIAWIGGRDFADAEVAKSLYKRAVGFKEVVEDFRTERGELVPIEKTMIFPGDVNAQVFWLKNRQPNQWKDKVEVQEEIVVAVTDKAEADARYKQILDRAQGLKDSFHGRAERMGLIMDGEFEEIDNER